MGKEVLLVVEAVSNEKGVDKNVIFEALEFALAAATKKRYEDEESTIRVTIDPLTGEYETFRSWQVMADDVMAILGTEFTTEEAAEKDANLQVGDVYEEKVENIGFGRIGAQAAKQIIVQKVREAERAIVLEQYSGRVGELISGTVKKVTRDNIIIEIENNAEAVLPKDQLINREIFRMNDRVRGILNEVRPDARGPQLVMSRIVPGMVIELFKIEVPEVAEQIIEIKGAARDAGSRSKIAVKTNDGRIDPIGACVGMRGSRVQAVSNELGGEKIDIVMWDDNPAQLVINAMAPAEVKSIIVDEDKMIMEVAVADENKAQAIGKSGQNVRLASELSGWAINILSESEASEKQDKEKVQSIHSFIDALSIDEGMAQVLVDEGFSTVEEIAYIAEEELLNIEGFDDELVKELRSRANDVLLTLELATEEKLEPAEDLLNMEGMTSEIAYQLAANGIQTMEDLAEQSIDEVMIVDDMDEEKAGELIMTARAPWFVNSTDA